MNSIASRLRERRRALLPHTIVARTTLAIVTLAMLVGILFASGAAWLVQRNEQKRADAWLDELLSTVESTVSIACFVQDKALAKEVARGLLSNRTVAAVYISVDGATLAFESRPGWSPQDGANITKSRKIHSPFNPDQVVGEILLYSSEQQIRSSANTYTGFISLILAFEVILVAGGVAWVVFNLITRPIKGISDELHRMELRTGMRLRVPAGNERDEIGRLVTDVNSLIENLTDLVEAERELREDRERSERKLRLIFDKSEAGIFTIGADGDLQSWNPAFERILHAQMQSSDKTQPVALQELLQPHAEAVNELMQLSLESGESCDADLALDQQGSGSAHWIELSFNPIDSGHLQGILKDITERKRAEVAAQQLALTDALTGLLNRRGLDAMLAKLFSKRTVDGKLAVAVLMLDLDWFKQVNDRYGHEAGDAVLRVVSERLQMMVRRDDLLARLGGDEFVIALAGVEHLASVENIARTVIGRLTQPIHIGDDIEVRIGTSIGIAFAPAGESLAVTLRRADAAMYEAKQAGRCTYRIAPSPAAQEPSNLAA